MKYAQGKNPNSHKNGFKKGNQIWLGKKKPHQSIKYKGKGNPFFGKKHNEETKKIISEANKRRHKIHPIIPPSHKGKTYQQIYGDRARQEIEKRRLSKIKHYDLIGRKNHEKYHWGYRYREWRAKVFQRDNWTCQTCGARGYIEPHHIKGWTKYPELRYEVSNGVTLCGDCHKLTNNYGNKHEKV